jgi:pilus assembly protein FimV
MSRNLPRVWSLLVLILTSEVWALGLGNIRLNSALNEPLRAEIELLSVMPEELQILDVLLASAETFERYGLDRPLFLQQINFNVVSREGVENSFIAITSLEPITKPLVSFLVEVTWLRGRLLRKYTLFFETSTFELQPDTKLAEKTSDLQQSSQTDSSMVERSSRLQTELPASKPEQALSPSPSLPPETSLDTIEGSDYHLVQQGDTLWSITQRVRPDNRLTMQQTMLAIFEANPEIFIGNINMMVVGANLRIPSVAEISRINQRDAPSEEQLKNTAWSSVKFDVGAKSNLVFMTSDDNQTSYDGGIRATESEVDAVTIFEGIRQIEKQIVDQEWLVEIRSDDLSALRTKSAGTQNEEIAESALLKNVDVTLADDDAMIDTKLKPTINDDIVIIESNISEDIRIDDAVSVKDMELDITTTLPRVVTLPAELSIGERMIELLHEFWRILIGALLIVLGILFWFSRRAERSDDENLTEVFDTLDAKKEDESPIERLVPGDVSSELHDAYTMMEVSTKLDLARAYVDMDGDVARSILGEVLDEGDEDQKKQAEHLLDLLSR